MHLLLTAFSGPRRIAAGSSVSCARDGTTPPVLAGAAATGSVEWPVRRGDVPVLVFDRLAELKLSDMARAMRSESGDATGLVSAPPAGSPRAICACVMIAKAGFAVTNDDLMSDLPQPHEWRRRGLGMVRQGARGRRTRLVLGLKRRLIRYWASAR